MSDQIPVAFTEKFRDDFIMLSQQKGSRLEATVRTDPDRLEGDAGYFDRIGATEMVENTTRHGDTPLVNTKHSRRRITLRDFDWADLIDKKDRVRILGGGQLPGRYLQNALWAAGRKKDDLIIAAANGNAFSIDEDKAASTVALPAAQKVAVNASGLTLVKLITTKEILDGADVDEDEERFMIVTSKQVSNLLNTTEVKSADYNTVKALVEGRIETFMGFRFIRTERLTKDSSSNRLALAYVRSALGLAIGEEIMADIGPRRDKRNSIQVYVNMTMDATRIEDEKLVQIACQE